MANFNIKLDEADFQILKETKALQIFDVETQEMSGEFDYPEDILKAHTPSVNAELQKEAQKDGLFADSYEIKTYLIIAKTENDVNELAFLQNEDAILVACTEVSAAEVNGEKDWKVFLLGVLF